MKDLFLTENQLTKTANTTKVDVNASNWGKEVLNRFYSDYPQLSNIQVTVNFKDKDEERGYGVGSLNLAGRMSLPVIIKDFQLFPFDTASTGDQIIPFTNETVEMLQANTPIFAELSKKEDTDAFLKFFDSPYGYGPGYAIEKGASVLDEINNKELYGGGLRPQIADELTSDPFLMRKLEKNAAFRLGLEKIAKFRPKVAQDLLKQASTNIQYIFEEKDGTFTKLSAYHSIDTVNVEKGLEKYEIADEESIIAVDSEKIAEFDPKLVATEGYVYKLANEEDIFIDKNGNHRIIVGKDYSMTKKAGFEDGQIDLLVDLSDIPASGDTGLLFNSEDGEIKTAVVEMRKVAFHRQGLHRITGEMALGTKNMTKFATLRGIDVPKYSSNGSTMYIPEKWSFAKLGRELTQQDLTETMNPKLAGLECIRCIGLDHYDFRGPVMRKYASRHGLEEANRHYVAFAALHCGASREDVEKIATLRPGQTHVMQTELMLPYIEDEVVKEANAAVNELVGTDSYLFDTQEVLKLAAEIGQETGVDAVLGTAFLRKDTLKQFIEMLPMFEEAASILAKMLLYIRMGADGLGEIPTREAMKHLTKVIYQLKGVKNMDKIKK